MKRPLFVYGSLMRGEELEGYLADSKAQAARTRGQLFRLPAGYPALVPEPDGEWVKGELVSLKNMARLQVLDLVEGVDRGLYKRLQIEVETESQKLRAWAYVMSAKQVRALHGRAISSGDWKTVSRAMRPQ